jgi:hypothetical protein
MATPDFFSKLGAGIKKIQKGAAKGFTRTFNPNLQTGLLPVPVAREHLSDLLTNRQTQNANQLMEGLFRSDPDVSAAVGAYLTLADTPMRMVVRTPEGEIDAAATLDAQKIFRALTSVTDYTLGFQLKADGRTLCQELRTMMLLRGAAGGELVLDKALVPSRIQHVDMSTIEWVEKVNGEYKPQQKVAATGQIIDLNIPNFFVSHHRRLPTTPYAQSDFVSAINTIAARQQVINDLYRIMRLTGFPRMTVEIVEEIMTNSAPASVKNDPVALRQWLSDRRDEIAGQFGDLRADQTIVHYDSSKLGMLNDAKPGAAMDITPVIEALNAQNQAGLKTMATVIGRGKSGVNTGTVEARIAAMNADQLNIPVAQFLSQMLTFAINLYGTAGFVEVTFEPAELRPNLELEPQRIIKQSRLQTDLSLGLITDEHYHWEMYGRLPPASAPVLSGTGFAEPQTAGVDTGSVSANSDPLGRSVAPAGSEASKSKGVKKPGGKPAVAAGLSQAELLRSILTPHLAVVPPIAA